MFSLSEPWLQTKTLKQPFDVITKENCFHTKYANLIIFSCEKIDEATLTFCISVVLHSIPMSTVIIAQLDT